MSNAEKTRKIGEAAVKAAEAEFEGKPYAVIVIVRQLPDAGMPINVATNITSGKPDVLRIMEEARVAVRGPLIV